MMRRSVLWALVLGAGAAVGGSTGVGAASVRQTLSLDGAWWFQTNGAPAAEWKRVVVPSSFQEHEGTNFHGVGWYRKDVGRVRVPPGHRALVHFEAAATAAEVWWNGRRVGEHLGGWTPFRFDVTACLAETNELRVRLDERVGHNTQGFLPIIAPHFGGLWQGIGLMVVPETHFDDLRLLAVGERASGNLRVEAPVCGKLPGSTGAGATASYRLRGSQRWSRPSTPKQFAAGVLRFDIPVADAREWSPEEPDLYEVEIALPGEGGDRVRTRAAFRSIEAVGSQLRLNGRPLSVRGLLNWGYSPPLVEPKAGEKTWREELLLARERGFNLMKFCLWVPPKRYLELADETGMLTWMEYPTWHPDFSEKHLGPLRREFAEFFEYDRNHPSVILRSLTCETGPSADIKVIQSLYDTAHALIPGALVEDDSSWIEWNRVHDFYDDHPYGNNHTWVQTLAGFREHIAARTNKPLVLGEAIAADTWLDRGALLRHFGERRPWWAPAPLDATGEWMEARRIQSGEGGLDRLLPDSLHYAMLMRKYQVEAFRREIPDGGYVISVIRDIPKASMGLVDYRGRAKWLPRDWAWHGETMCLLRTPGDARGFEGGKPLCADFLVSHFAKDPLEDARLDLTLARADGETRKVAHRHVRRPLPLISPGQCVKVASVEWDLPAVVKPSRLLLRMRVDSRRGDWANAWPIWVVPAADRAPRVQVHASVDRALAAECFPHAPAFDAGRRKATAVASVFDQPLMTFLERGGRVLLIPNGQRHSLPSSAHWFLRGAPHIPDHPLAGDIPRGMWLELQHFDLAANVVPSLPQLQHVDPALLLWDTHDLGAVKTHGLVFETSIGEGRLLVSALRHDGTNNAAGRWTLSTLLSHLETGPAPDRSLPAEVWQYAKSRLEAVQVNLAEKEWEFRPDPEDLGLAEGWHRPSTDRTGWKPIKIGGWWESNGYPALDGWAWYRLRVEPPAPGGDGRIYLTFEGVDDFYELFINGEWVAKRGDLATRKDTLSERFSHDITRFVRPGEPAVIAVRVHDWYGAGGIFRPVTLGTLPLRPELDFLR